MNDDEIIGLFYARSERAVDELKKKYGTVIRRTAFHVLNNYQDTEECENDTYMAAWNQIPPENPDPLAAYLCRISRNLAIARYHSKTAAKRNSVYDIVLDELDEVLAGKNEDPVSAYEFMELTKAIERFLDGMNKTDRKIFMYRYWFSWPVTEIATKTGLSQNGVSVRLSRIRCKLQKYLKKEGFIS